MNRSPSRRINIYDGSRLLGVVRETADRTAWLAADPNDEPLGQFPDSKSAALAVTTDYDKRSAERLRKARAG